MNCVSIIIPIYNIKNYVDKCIQSAVYQTYSDIEIILVDDGSTDGSAEKCDEWELKDSRIKVIHKENGGLSSARNAGLDIAKGEYIYFLDGDDYISPVLIGTVVNPMINSGADMVAFNYSSENDGFIKPIPYHKTGSFDLSNDTKRINYIIHDFKNIGWEAWSRIYRKDIIDKHNLRFEDNKRIFAEDLYFCLCYSCHTNKIVSIEDTLYYYVQRTDSIMSQNQKKINIGRMHELYKAACLHFESCSDCDYILEYLPLIYFLIINNELSLIKKNITSNPKEIRNILINNIPDFSLFKKQVKQLSKFKEELYSIYGTSAAKELLSEYLFYSDGNYPFLALRNRHIYKNYISPKACGIIPNEQELIDFSHKENKIYYLGSEEYGNIGDHQINESTLTFLTSIGFSVFEVTAEEYQPYKTLLLKYITPEDIIVLSGGGNVYDIYPFQENIRHDIISTWKNNKKIIFPQTVYFSNSTEGNEALQKAKVKYSNENNVVFFARENKSFDFIRSNFSCCCSFAPDIVLSQNLTNNEIVRSNQIVFCLRSDTEKAVSDYDKDSLIKAVHDYSDNVVFTDLQMSHHIQKDRRSTYIKAYLDIWKASKIIITDRLHGMIFAAVTGTPCIALSNFNHKILGTYNIISYLPYIKYANSIDEAKKFVPELLNMSECKFDNSPIAHYYDKIAEVIKNK